MANKFKVGDMVRLVGDTKSTWGKGDHYGRVVTIKSADNCVYPYIMNGCPYRWRDSELEVVRDKIVITHDGKTTTATLYCGDSTKKEEAIARCAPEDTFDFAFGANLAMYRLMECVENSKYTVVKVQYHNARRTYSYKTKDTAAKVGMKIIVPVGTANREIEATITEVISGHLYKGEYPISEMKEIEIKEVKLYNGKVVCVGDESCSSNAFTVGKIYEIRNGKFIDNNGYTRPMSKDCIKTLDDLKNEYFSNWCYKFIPLVE